VIRVRPSSELTPEEKAELAKYLPQEIDVNMMADLFYLVSQSFTLIKDKYGKVEPWGIEAQQLKNFLQSLSDFEIEVIKINRKQTISLDRVLSKPSNKWRLALALAHLEARYKAAPICVNAYRVEGMGCWYIVTDGVHRTTAAKIMGQEEIEAVVIREIVLDCPAIRRNYPQSPTESYFLEVLGIKRSLRGLIELIWNLCKSMKSELDD
jgi:hypothetical protein